MVSQERALKHNKFWKNVIIKTGAIWSLLFLVIILSITSDVFFTYSNLINILKQVVIISILGIGMTFVIIGGGIDLSVGSALALCGAIAAKTMVSTNSVFLSVLTALLIGLLMGLAQGIIISKGGVAPFAVTLGGLAIFRGLTLIYTNGMPISGFSMNFRFLGAGYIGQVPAPIIVALIVFIIAWIILYKTKIGRYIYAMGSNENATRLTGVKVDYYRTISYSISGVCSALAGVIMVGRINSAHPQAGAGYELEAIAAVVIGGTSLSGGRGNLYGAIFGAVLIGVIRNGLNLLHVNAFWQDVTVGIVIVLAVLIDRFRIKLAES